MIMDNQLEYEIQTAKTSKELLGDNYIIRKGNSVINAQFPHMDTMELRIIGLAAAQIRVDASKKRGFQSIVLPKHQVAKRNTGYPVLKKVADSLMNRKVVLEDNDQTFSVVQLVIKCTISKNTGYFQVDFHPDIVDQLLELKQNFTRIPNFIVLKMPTFHSLRMYEIIACHKDFVESCYKKYGNHPDYKINSDGQWRLSLTFELKELQRMLGIQEEDEEKKIEGTLTSYVEWSPFQVNVLKKTQKHFKKYSNFLFEFKGEKRVARSTTHVIFIITQNPKPQQAELFEAWDSALNITDKKGDHVDIPVDLITKVPAGQWDTEDGCKTVCEEIAVKKGLEAVGFYINFALSYPGGAKSFGKVIRFALKEELFEKHIESIKAMEKAEEVENKAKAEQDEKTLVEYRAMPDREIQRLHNVGDPIAIKVWEEGRGKEIEEKEAAERENLDIELELIKNLLDTDLEGFTDFAGAGPVGAAKYKRWRDQYLDTKEIPFGVQMHLASVLSDYMTHKKEQEKVNLKVSLTGIEEAKHQIAELFEKSTPEQREVLKAMFSPEKMELANEIIDELSQPK